MTAQLLTDAGGSRAWRRIVAAVLARDGNVCHMRRDGHRCGAPATTANHIVARILGGGDELSNLEAACVPCNMGAGAAAAALARRSNATMPPAAVEALVRLLDAAGLASEAGRRRALQVLASRSAHPWRAAQIDAACAYRRARGPLTRI